MKKLIFRSCLIIGLVSLFVGSAMATNYPAAPRRQERSGHHSYISCYRKVVLPGGVTFFVTDAIQDYDFSKHVKTALNTKSPNYNEVIFTFNQCFSGGFVNDIAATGIKAVVSTASEYYESSWGKGYAEAWRDAVSSPGGVGVLAAYNHANTHDPFGPIEVAPDPPKEPNKKKHWEHPQYFSSIDALDDRKLGQHSDNPKAILFVGQYKLSGEERFLDETAAMYDLLVNQAGPYKYASDNVKVLFGTHNPDPNKLKKWDSEGTKENLFNAISNFAAGGGLNNEQLFIWVFDHGDHTVPTLQCSFSVEDLPKVTPPQGYNFEGQAFGFTDGPPRTAPSEVYVESTHFGTGYGPDTARGGDGPVEGDIFTGGAYENFKAFDETDLGLFHPNQASTDGDFINALSPGNDLVGKSRLWFSVENLQGDEGKALAGDLRRQSNRGEHPGDIYESWTSNKNRAENKLAKEEVELGLNSTLVKKGSGDVGAERDWKNDDNLASLEVTHPFAYDGNAPCFSLAKGSPFLAGPDGKYGKPDFDDDGIGGEDDIGEWGMNLDDPDVDDLSSADIFRRVGGVPNLIIDHKDIDLTFTDDLDAMILNLTLGGNKDTWDLKDVIRFSLAPGSPTLGPAAKDWKPGDILSYENKAQAKLELWVHHFRLDLDDNDNLDALDSLCPCPNKAGHDTFRAPAVGELAYVRFDILNMLLSFDPIAITVLNDNGSNSMNPAFNGDPLLGAEVQIEDFQYEGLYKEGYLFQDGQITISRDGTVFLEASIPQLLVAWDGTQEKYGEAMFGPFEDLVINEEAGSDFLNSHYGQRWVEGWISEFFVRTDGSLIEATNGFTEDGSTILQGMAGSQCVPEPGTVVLVGLALVALAGVMRKKMR